MCEVDGETVATDDCPWRQQYFKVKHEKAKIKTQCYRQLDK